MTETLKPTVTPTTPVPNQPWFSWPPDRKVLAGGIAGLVAWILLSLLRHFTSFDLQPVLDTIFGMGTLDMQAVLSTAIAILIAHVTAPSVRDIVKRVDNGIVTIANADPDNPTTAVVVDEETSDTVAERDLASGKIPPAIADKLKV